jgi:hypothetical protein
MDLRALGEALEYLPPQTEEVLSPMTQFPPPGPYRAERRADKIRWTAVPDSEWNSLNSEERARVYIEKALIYLDANGGDLWLTARPIAREDLTRPAQQLFGDSSTVEEFLCRAYHQYKLRQIPVELSVTGVAELLAWVYGYPVIVGAGSRVIGMLLEAIGSQVCEGKERSRGIPRIVP